MNPTPFRDDRIIKETGLEARVAHIVGPVIDGLGYRLVRVKLSGRDGLTMQIMAEHSDRPMAIEDCEELSRSLSPVLDVADLIDRAYRLEMSSPGLDRPLVRRSDFEEAIGQAIKLELSLPVDGRKRYRGSVTSVENDLLRLREDEADTDASVRLHDIAEARLLLTEAIVAEALRAGRRRRKEDAKAKKLARATPPGTELKAGD